MDWRWGSYKKNIGTLTSSSTGFINVQSKTFCSQPETGKEFVEYCLVLEQTSWGYIKVLGSQLPLPPPLLHPSVLLLLFASHSRKIGKNCWKGGICRMPAKIV